MSNGWIAIMIIVCVAGIWRALDQFNGQDLNAVADAMYNARSGLVAAVDQMGVPSVPADPWRLDEYAALPDVCLIAACDGSDIDPRGPVQLRTGAIGKACVEHWEGIFRVLGEQASWERTDGARTVAVSTQDAPSVGHVGPQGDAEGSGVAQDDREAVGAEKGVQRACACPWDNGHHIACPTLAPGHWIGDACDTSAALAGHRDA